MTLDEIAKIANALGGASFATLLFIILVGNYKDVWCWGRVLVELKATHHAEKEELRERFEAETHLLSEQVVFWRDIALRNTGLLETQTEQLMQVATQVGAVNRKLLSDKT